jgi:hypothetical protein
MKQESGPMPPLVYLISRQLTQDQTQKVIDALSLTPVDVVIAAPQDVERARNFCEQVTGLHKPIAIVADFDHPLTAVERDGSLKVINV